MQTRNDYAAVLAVAMDDKPLASSASILVQVGTTARPSGWREKAVTWKDESGQMQNGFEIVSIGQAPWQVVCNDVSLTINNPTVSRAVVLDMNGMKRGELLLARDGAKASFQMPRDAMYVVLQ